MNKSILIIGGGIAGLSAGCYARMNGYGATILEMHTLPGGLCTSWQRNGYTIDGCIHWLVGCAPDHPLYQVWDELGALRGRTLVHHDEFVRILTDDGQQLIMYTDARRLEEHLLEISSKQASLIRGLTRSIRKFSDFRMSTIDAPEAWDMRQRFQALAGLLPFLPRLIRYGRVSLQDYAARFEDEFLRRAIAAVFNVPDFPMIGVFAVLGWLHGGYSGYPVGGSLEFSRAIEQRYRNLGGEIRYASKVDKILVENDRAVGVRLDDGTELSGNYVISAADMRSTLFDMLNGRYIDERFRRMYESLTPMTSLLYMSLGVRGDLSKSPHLQTWLLDQPIVLSGVPVSKITVGHFGHDPTLTPQGKSLLNVMVDADYDHWRRLSTDRSRYDAEKRAVSEALIALIEQRIPGVAGNIEMIDLATPHTFERYTGNCRGSWEGWHLTTRNCTLSLPATLRKLGNFRMIGHWTQPVGGLPLAALSGRHAIQIICREQGKTFETKRA